MSYCRLASCVRQDENTIHYIEMYSFLSRCPNLLRFGNLKDKQGVSEGCAVFGASIYNYDRCYCTL